MKKITETKNIASNNLDELKIYDILYLMNKEDATIHHQVFKVLPLIILFINNSVLF